MKQVLQNQKNGKTELVDVPAPLVKNGYVLIRTTRTLISPGTERAVLEFGKASILEKARGNPDKVRMVLERLKTEGVLETYQAVARKLEQRIPLGYCNAGIVLEIGKGVHHVRPGDRVASNGKHAELVNVPANLCVKIADSVTDDHATFTVLGAIGLEGLRLAQPTLGETFVVIGLGLVGLITVQLLLANGCRVLGIDMDSHRLSLARRFGAHVVDLSVDRDPVAAALVFTRERGVDGVIVTASTTSSYPIHQAAQMCRKRGRIILVGVTGLDLTREDFYEKETSFQVSCSYGPGRYDPVYEEHGHDYPFGFVRWTEQRNMEAMMDMLEARKIDVDSLISHRFPLEKVEGAYDVLSSGVPSLAIILEYYQESERPNQSICCSTVSLSMGYDRGKGLSRKPVVSFIGAGDHAVRILIPSFEKAGVVFKSIATSTGTTCYQAAKQFGFQKATTDADSVFSDPEVDCIVIATRHDTHARFTKAALKSGKHVFVEKPLAISREGLDDIVALYTDSATLGLRRILTVGFNRRFAPHIQRIHELIHGHDGPRSLIMTVNAGRIPSDSWIQDSAVGGGRIIGEGCHFIDLLRYLAQSPIASVQAESMEYSSSNLSCPDTATFTLTFQDGSMGTIHYFANGHKTFPKERLEVFCSGKILQMNNFQKLQGWGWPRFKKTTLWKQDKGHAHCVKAFVDAVRDGGPPPIPLDQLVEVTKVSLMVDELLVNRTCSRIELPLGANFPCN